MSMGKRARERQAELFLATDSVAQAEGHPFYRKLNQLLSEHGFDSFVESICSPYYEAKGPGRPSIPPGTYFRMLFIGYFEGIDSQRGIAWRANDSLSLREFLGVSLTEETPDHSTLTKTRQRLPLEIHERVFQFVLRVALDHKLLSAKTVGVDSTTLEANAAMKSIVRKETGEDWRAYVLRLMREEGMVGEDEEPTDEEIRRYDKKRKKKVSNEEWESSTDPDAEITKMKDGRTHLAYKAEHVVDLESEFILAAEIRPATDADSETLVDSVLTARGYLEGASTLEVVDAASGETTKPSGVCCPTIEEAAADKGYHAASTLALAVDMDLRTYIPERQNPRPRRWHDKPDAYRSAVLNNRKRVAREKSKHLQRLRSERVERSFAHVCDTGGSRRTWLRGLEKVAKRYLMQAAARNLGQILLALFGVGKPRMLQAGIARAILGALRAFWTFCNHTGRPSALLIAMRRDRTPIELQILISMQTIPKVA